MTPNSVSIHEQQILPALRGIEARHGYLNRQELERFSKESGVPLYRLQEVASYFPHFHLTQPAQITVQVCRDMACHLAGAESTLTALRALAGENLSVEGVSCLGRCDRPPAVCVAIGANARSGDQERAQQEERYYLGRDIDDLTTIIDAFLHGDHSPPSCNADAGGSGYPGANWVIDSYKDSNPDYQAIKKIVAIRDDRLRRAAEILRTELKLPVGASEQLLEAVRGIERARFGGGMSDGSEKWVEAVLAELDDANASLRGMGGAGVPATQKWRDVRLAVAEARRRGTDERAFVVVNGDESEPGTFKDRELLLHFPHLVVEGVILAGLVTNATQGFIYIRHEYHEQIAACEAEIRRAEAQGVCGADAPVLGRSFPVSVFVSPGGYICGEQSALIEVMSDRRGEPRNVPPKLETNGLNNLPTLVSNVETFAWVPYIVINGGKTYAGLGVNGRRGRRFFSVSGDVNRPGVYEVPMGLTLRELICSEEYCHGIPGGRKLKAIAPSGPSGGFLPARLTAGAGLPRNHTANPEWQGLALRRKLDPLAQELDILDLELELDLFRALSPTQALGAGIVVYDERRDMTEQAANALEFFRNESCGKCVPCRVGSQKLANLGTNLLAGEIDTVTWRRDLAPVLSELGEVMSLTSICGLGRSVPMPLRTMIDYFGEDLARHLM